MATEIVLVLASARNDVIGADGTMPWHLPADLAHFKALTLNATVLMGRRTFESLGRPPRPLPQRTNIVLTRDPHWAAAGVQVYADVDRALEATQGRVFVIGGAQLYRQLEARAQRLEWTRIHAQIDGDTQFRPDTTGFIRTQVTERPADARNVHALTFETWQREPG